MPMGICSAYWSATVTPGLVFAVQRCQGVLVSQSTISGLGFSEGGNEHAGALGVSLTGRSFF
jgi:hypothetical protein